VTPRSCFLPVRQRHQFVSDFQQPLKSAFVIWCALYILAVTQVFAVRFADLRYFFPQLGDAIPDGVGHGK
jgi:hypothetical protein